MIYLTNCPCNIVTRTRGLRSLSELAQNFCAETFREELERERPGAYDRYLILQRSPHLRQFL